MKHSMEHMRMHAIGDDELDIVSGGAGGAYDYTVICQGCSKELKPGRLVYGYKDYARLCDTCFREMTRCDRAASAT